MSKIFYYRRFLKALSLLQLIVSMGLSLSLILGVTLSIRSFVQANFIEDEKTRLLLKVDEISDYYQRELEQIPRLKDGTNSISLVNGDTLKTHLSLIPIPLTGSLKIQNGIPVLKTTNSLSKIDDDFFQVFKEHVNQSRNIQLILSGQSQSIQASYLDLSDPIIKPNYVEIPLDPLVGQGKVVTLAQQESKVAVSILYKPEFHYFPEDKELWHGSSLDILKKKNMNQNTPASLLGKNIDSVDYLFSFTNYETNTTKSLPTKPISGPNTPYTGHDGTNCPGDPTCVSWADVQSVIVVLILSSNEKFISEKDKKFTHEFFLKDEKLKLKRSFEIFLRNFSGPGKVNDQGVDPTCQVLSPFRCVPGNPCESEFNSSNPSDYNWIGYLSGSSYCNCGTPVGGDYQADFETNHILHDWDTTEGKAKHEACAEAFGCSYINTDSYIKDRSHPAWYLACRCVHPDLNDDTGKVIEELTSQDDNFAYHLIERDFIPGDPRGFGNELVGNASDSNLKCKFWRANIKNKPGGSCHAAAKDLVGGEYAGGENFWETKCKCQSRTRNENGDDLGPLGAYTDWSAVCGESTNFEDNSTQAIECESSVEFIGGPGPYYYRYKTYPTESEEALTEHQQKTCFCLKQKNNYTWSVHSNFRDESSEHGPGSFNEARYGLDAINFDTGTTFDCAVFQCNTFSRDSTGCCVEEMGSISEADFINNGGNPTYSGYRNYCYSKCGRLNNLSNLQRFLLDITDPNDPLPFWCGGNDGGGGGDGGNQ